MTERLETGGLYRKADLRAAGRSAYPAASGRWLAEVVELPGVLAYGETQEVALARVQGLALRVIAERLEHGEAQPERLKISFDTA